MMTRVIAKFGGPDPSASVHPFRGVVLDIDPSTAKRRRMYERIGSTGRQRSACTICWPKAADKTYYTPMSQQQNLCSTKRRLRCNILIWPSISAHSGAGVYAPRRSDETDRAPALQDFFLQRIERTGLWT